MHEDEFSPRDVMAALRYEGSEEDVRMIQYDIGRLLRRLTPDQRFLILLYSSGYNAEQAGKKLNMKHHDTKRKFDRAIRRLTYLLNGDRR